MVITEQITTYSKIIFSFKKKIQGKKASGTVHGWGCKRNGKSESLGATNTLFKVLRTQI